MPSTKLRYLLGLLALALVALAYVFLRPVPTFSQTAKETSVRVGAEDSDAATPAAADATLPRKAAAALTQRRDIAPLTIGAATAPLPLPPSGQPVMEVYEELAARARRGDAHASCRLAMDLLKCQRLPSTRRFAAQQERSLRDAARRSGDDAAWLEKQIEWTARMSNTVEQLEPLCEGVDTTIASQAFDWLQRAAELGHAPSMVVYARSPAIDPDRLLENLDRVRAYRNRAPQFAQAALLAGNRDIVRELAEAHLPIGVGHSMLGQTMPADRVQAYGYHLLAQRVAPQPPPAPLRPTRPGPDRGARFREGLSPADEAAAQAFADDLYARHFADRPPPAPARTQIPGESRWNGSNPGSEICERDD